MNETVFIQQRFHGPPGMGNGGYVCGRVAQFIQGPAEVTLHWPAPLDRPLTIHHADNGQVWLTDDEQMIATARPATLELDVPQPPTYAAALAAGEGYGGFHQHPFPTCFVCGPERNAGDGLRIFPSSLPGGDVVAAPWIPAASLADKSGFVRPEYLWAALDCPGGIAAVGQRPRPILLGRLTAVLQQPIHPSRRYVVAGWEASANGRKHLTDTAIFTASGVLCAHASAVWIEPKRQQMHIRNS